MHWLVASLAISYQVALRVPRCAPSCVMLASEYGTAFPEGFDPNYFPADTRTFAGAVASPPAKDTTTRASPAVTKADIDELTSTFDFDNSSDEQVLACEAAIFDCLRREAKPLASSFFTSGLVGRCVLQHSSLPEALGALLSGKMHETLPGSMR